MHRPLTKGAEATPATPLSADEFSALMVPFGPFAKPCRIAVAVSGGPDSMALVWLVKNWIADRELIALTVDHGLRPESVTEAVETQKRLSAYGIASEILRWEHPPVVSRLHVSARKARYQLLLDACRRRGIDTLLLAHQREDQAETILMRFAKGGGIEGLSGMAAFALKDGVRLLRPLLGVPKERLIATCDAAQLPFIRDPSNASDKFARGRLRRVLPLLAEEGFTVERLLLLGARAAEVSASLEHYVKIFLHDAVEQDEAGVLHVKLDLMRGLPHAVAQRALAACLTAIHADDYASEQASLDTLLAALLATEPMPARTLQGCLIVKNDNRASIMREYSAIIDAPLIRAGESIVWDGRWDVTLRRDAEISEAAYQVRPLGNPPHEIVDKLAPGLRRLVPQGRARASLPTLWCNEVLVLIPRFGRESGAENAVLCARICDKRPWQ
jgi:tRNA(Ile)-lysidine synthase